MKMVKFKCPNNFTCYNCKKNFHRKRPLDEAILEHAERLNNFDEYKQISKDSDLVEVCNDCFKKFNHLFK